MEAQPGTVRASPGGNGGASAQMRSCPAPAQRKGARNCSAPAQPRMERAGPAAGEVPVHAGIGLTGPSRERGDLAQPGTKRASPARILPPLAQPGSSPRQPRRDAGAPEHRPSRGPKFPEPTGKCLTQPRTSLLQPRKAKIAICRPEGVITGQKKIYAGWEVPESTPGPHMSAET
jgi:hypothetical protein